MSAPSESERRRLTDARRAKEERRRAEQQRALPVGRPAARGEDAISHYSHGWESR